MKSNRGMRFFCNVVGSSSVTPNRYSHIGDWELSRNEFRGGFGDLVTCSAQGCHNTRVVGAHIQEIVVLGNIFSGLGNYVIPLCQQHNMYRGYMIAKAGVHFAPVGHDGRVLLPDTISNNVHSYKEIHRVAFGKYESDSIFEKFESFPKRGAFLFASDENIPSGAFGAF